MIKETKLLMKTFFLTSMILCLVTLETNAQSRVQVVIDTENPGVTIPEDYIGFSFEMERLLPGKNGSYYFSPANEPLIKTLKMFGLKSLRVGGNTADRPWIDVPNETDIDTFFAFVKKLDGVKVIYTVRLREGNRERAADIAKYIMDNYSSLIDCFAIGNEPNMFAKEYDVYKDEWEKYTELIISKSPNAKFCGPSSTPGKTEWSEKFANDFANSGIIKFISQHAYPGGNGSKVEDPAAERKNMLSIDWIKSCKNFYNSFVPAAEVNGLPYRIEEVNSFYNGGAVNVSNTFASALWGLDYMYWWAQHNMTGINFHTGDSVAAGDGTNPCMYASFVTSDNGYYVRPLGYAVKAFDMTAKGSFVPLQFTSNDDDVNVTGYAVLSQNKNLFITLINKEIGEEAREVNIVFKINGKFAKGEVMHLNSPGGDAAVTGIKLGNSEITDSAEWNGEWTLFEQNLNDGDFIIDVPATSAALIKLSFE